MTELAWINPKEAESVLFDPDLYNRAVDDNTPAIEACPEGPCYLGGYVDDTLVAVFIVHETPRGYQFHTNILRPYRDYKYELSFPALDKFLTEFGSLYCEVPSLYPEVLAYAKNIGFAETETLEKEYKKNGQLYDLHILEIREES